MITEVVTDKILDYMDHYPWLPQADETAGTF